MPKRIPYIIILIFLVLQISGFTQSKSLKVGLELPLQYSFGYENRFSEGFSFYGQIGAVFFPFNYTSLGMMEYFGGNKEMTKILETNFQSGLTINAGGNYYFSKQTRKNYAGPVFKYYNMFKADISDNDINNYFNVDLSSADFPIGPIPKTLSTEPLTLSTNFMQIGFVVGRRVSFYKKDDFELHVELGLSKTIYSNTVIESDFRYLGSLKDEINKTVDEYYKKHAVFTTFNLYFIYKFSYEKF